MADKATIYRTQYGVPHIYGGSLRAMSFAHGYAQAQDHLELMLRSYRWGSGRMCEVDGEGALESDREAHHFEIPEIAEQGYPQLPQDARDICEGFAAGVNRYMAEHPDKTQAWAQPVRPQDIIMLTKRYVLYCDHTIPLPILKRFQQGNFSLEEERDTKTVGLIQEETELHSNMWAIMPRKCAEGVAVFSGDPHTPWGWPFSFYEAHLNAPGLNLGGGFTYGMPMPSIGFNDDLAWSLTANDAKTGSFFLEKPNSDNPDLYKYDDAWRPLRKRVKKIKIKNGDGFEERELEFIYTHRGPAFRNDTGQLASVQMPGYYLCNLVGQGLAQGQARNADEFRDALAMLEQTSLNMLCADRDGDIYYVNIGRMARRNEAYDWRNAVPGWTSETEWGEIHSFDELAQVKNPPSGFLQNCNVQAWTVTTDCPIKEEDYPDSFYFKGDVGIRPRGELIKSTIVGKDKMSIEEMKQLVFNDYVLQAEALKPLIARAVKRMTDDSGSKGNKDLVRRVDDGIQAWDNHAAADRAGATLFHLWVSKVDKLVPDKLAASKWEPTEDELDRVVQALQETGELLERVHGRLDVPYGVIHYQKRGGKRFPINGGFRTLRCAVRPAGPDENGVFECDFGQGYVMVVAFTDPVQAYTALPYGVSEAPDSPHHADQAPLYSTNRLKRFPMQKDEVLAEAESEMTLEVDATPPSR